MSIEINGNNRPPVNTGEASATKYPKNDNSSTNKPLGGTPSRADSFSLTHRATQLRQLEAQIAQLPVVDTQRVAEVQHALATGTLEIHPARVADKLLSFEVGLSPQKDS